jgi:hypothetical protein
MPSRPDIPNHIKVLSEQQQIHYILCGGTLDFVMEIHDGCSEPIHYGLALFGNSNAWNSDSEISWY